MTKINEVFVCVCDLLVTHSHSFSFCFFFSFLKILAFILIRNIPGYVRSVYSSFFAWFGKISLEVSKEFQFRNVKMFCYANWSIKMSTKLMYCFI